MNKITSFLLLVVSVLIIGTVSSCKDTNEDLYKDLNSKYLTLNKTLENERDNLQRQIDVLKNHIDNCDCDARYEEIKGLIAALNDAIVALENNKADKTAVANLQTQINNLKERLDNLVIPEGCACAEKWNTLLNVTIPGLEAAIAGKVDTETFETAKNLLQQSINDLTTEVNLIKEQKASKEELTAAVNTLTALINGVESNLTQKIGEVNEKVGNVIGRLDNFAKTDQTIEDFVTGLKTEVNKLQTTVGELQTDLGIVKGKADANEQWINDMKALYGDNLEKLVVDLSGYATKEDLETLASKTELENVKTEVETLSGKIDDLQQQYDDLMVVLEATIDDIQADYAERDEVLRQQIEAVKGDLENLKERVEALETAMEKVSGQIKDIQDRLNSQITSIIVQSVTTPLFLDANIALPVGLQTNVICAYYGEVKDAESIDFPGYKKVSNLSDDDELLSRNEAINVKGFGVMYNGDSFESTGGKIYLTINPSTVNFTGAGLKLVDSQNGDSGFELENVQKSDKLLSFASRAADNGFYEADVTLVNKDKAAFNSTPLRNAAKEVYNLLKTHTGVRDMATSVVKAAYKSVNLPAYAVQAPYTYKDENGDEVTAYVHSNYNIAATAVHPLSYNLSGKLGNYTSKIPQKKLRHIPYISEKLLDLSSWGEIKGKLYFEFDDVDYEPKNFSFTIPGFSLNDVDLTVTVKNVSFTYQVPTSYDPEKKEFTAWADTTGVIPEITVPITGKELVDIEKAIQTQILNNLKSQFDDLNGKMNNLQLDFVSAINAALENTADMINTRAKEIIEILEGLAKKSDKYVNRVNNLIDRVNNQLDKVYSRLDNVDHYLLPIMFYRNANGDINFMSAYESSASYVTAGYMTLYPTSYTVEILNPAAKKVVQVTKAKKISTGVNDEAEVEAANASFDDLNKVIDGSVRAVGIQLKSGYAYEIAYSALDYTGYQVTQRYWVKVK